MVEDIALLHASAERLRDDVERLTDAQVAAPSRLPGWTRGHVITHLARAADSRRRLLDAARAGLVGRQYESEEARAAEIDDQSARAGTHIISDFGSALDHLSAAIDAYPADKWEAPGEWLGVGRRPVGRVVTSMRRELELHHVDLDVGYEPANWPPTFVTRQIEEMLRKPGMPAVTVRLPQHTVHNGPTVVTGQPTDVLAWLTGRGDGSRLRVDPDGPLPQPTPLN